MPDLSSGLLLLDKSPGPTSHDAVQWCRRVLKNRRVGHCGTLDPAASGLLLVAVGEALGWQDRFTAERKVYSGAIRFGVTTDTDDLAGREIARGAGPLPDRAAVEAAFRSLTGRFEQKVPRYSAVKVGGRRLYELAREGTDVDLPVKTVEVSRFDLLGYEPPDARFRVECSKGTYVRSLARDAGEKLGAGGALASLRREAVGAFRVEDALPWRDRMDADPGALAAHFVPLAALGDKLRAGAA